MTTRAERHSSPRWPVAWFLSLRSPWRRVVKRNREREGRMTPLPLPAPTLTCWHGAFLILVCTVPRDFSSRIWTPLHPPKYIGMMCSLFTVRLVFWEGLMVIMTPTNRYLWSETRRVFLGCFSFLVVLSCWGGVAVAQGLECVWKWLVVKSPLRAELESKRAIKYQSTIYPQAQASIVWFQRGDERRRFGDAPAHQKASASEEENQTVWRAVWEGEKLQGKIRTLMVF